MCAGARDLRPSPWRSVSARTEVGREVELVCKNLIGEGVGGVRSVERLLVISA